MKSILVLALISIFSIGGLAQDRGWHRGYRNHRRPVYVYQPVQRQVYSPYQRRAVKVVVYLDAYGNVRYTDTNFADNMYVNDRYVIEADRKARNKHFAPTGRDHKKTVYIYFSY